jgi:hypothetical protein
MSQQAREPNQQETCRNKQENRINNKHAGRDKQNRINNKHVATSKKTESTTDMQQQPNDKQNRINNRHAGTTNRIESTTDMSQQRTEPIPSSHLCFVCWPSFRDIRWSLLSADCRRIL